MKIIVLKAPKLTILQLANFNKIHFLLVYSQIN